MKLWQMVDALPESWSVRQNRYIPTPREKREKLDPYKVGLERVREMMLPYNRLSDAQIIEIGSCSIEHKRIMVVREGKEWTIVSLTSANVRAYKGHGYIIKGKKVVALQHHKQGSLQKLMDDFEYHANDCPISVLDTEGLFHAFKGQRIHKGKKKGGESSTHVACRQVCASEDHSRPWKEGERAYYKGENKKHNDADFRERTAMAIIRVAQVGLTYRAKAMR